MGRLSTGLIALGIVFALQACGEDSGGGSPVAVVPTPPPSPPPPPPPPPPAVVSTERDIVPALTNAALTDNLSAHFAINPVSATAKGRLFVMLPGTGAVPRFYRLVVRAGAARGYHSIGLTYPNDETVGGICAGSTRPDCAGEVRREIITGNDISNLVTITAANSITGRLVSLLTYMQSTYPNEGWGQYLVNGQPNWSAITMAGHSQGSGHAAYMAKLYTLDRMVMFSGPSDTGNGTGSPAPWISLPNATPPSRQYGFTHQGDELVPLVLVTFNWGQLGLGAFGAPVSVDGSAAPYGDRRQLTTSIPIPLSPLSPATAPQHGGTVVDVVTPLAANGEPLYLPVWSYMAFP
jgi:hypothetical protein